MGYSGRRRKRRGCLLHLCLWHNSWWRYSRSDKIVRLLRRRLYRSLVLRKKTLRKYAVYGLASEAYFNFFCKKTWQMWNLLYLCKCESKILQKRVEWEYKDPCQLSFFIRFLCHKAVHTCCRYFHKKIEIFSRYVLFRSNYNKQLFVTISWLHLLACGLLCQ